VKKMTVNSMARQTMMFNTISGTNPMFANQGVSAPTTSASKSASSTNLQTGSNHAFATSASVRGAGYDLLDATKGKQAEFSQFQAASSNTNTATVTVDNSSFTSGAASALASNNVRLDVSQTALSQTNAGEAMSAADRGVDAGEYTFSIETGGQTHTFSLTVGDNDTNESIQERMAAAINEANIGITASVTADAENGTTSLSLASDNTGTDAAFTVTDDSGNLASAMGVDAATQEAQNAIYSVNGGAAIESQSNTVAIAQGVTATLNGSGTTTVSAERETQGAVAAATDLVNALNSTLRSANAGDGRGSTRLANDIQTLTRNYSSQLASVGINVSRNGELTIDEARLQKAAQDGSLDRLFNNERTGFSARAERIGSNAVNSERYADMQLSFFLEQGQLKLFNLGRQGMFFDFLI